MDELLDAWLDLGPTVAPDRIAHATSAEIRTMPQRRATWWPVRRTPTMSKFLAVGLAAVAIVVAAVIGYRLLGTNSSIGPYASASPSPTMSPTPSDAVAGPGALDPGTHTLYAWSSPFDQRDDKPRFNIQFTVPDGWSWDGSWMLYKGGATANGAVVSLWTGDMQVYTDPCQWQDADPSPPTGSTATDLIEALAAQPRRDASEPVARNAPSAEVPDAWQGMSVTLSVPADLILGECRTAQFRSWGRAPNERYAQGPGQRDYVWALNVVDERLVIDAAVMPDVPDEWFTEAQAIMDSLVIEPAG